MKKIYIPMMRYGDKEFDEGFVGWGFNSYDDQIRDANAVLNIMRRPAMKMLDLGCGLGIYHKVWLDAGHAVVGVDLSETFIFMAQNNNDSYPQASYRCENFEEMADQDEFDCVTMIDTPVENDELAKTVFNALNPGGAFLFQVSNPHYDHARGPLFVKHRDWIENEDRTFLLTRHEYNESIDRWVYEEWHIDIEKAEIVVQHNHSHNLRFRDYVVMLKNAGFATVCFLDDQGSPYEYGAEEPRNYFCVAKKGGM